MLKDLLPLLQFQDLVFLSGSAAVVVSTIIQALSKKYKPWTWLAQQFGKAANKEVLTKLDVLEERVDKLEEKANTQKNDSEIREIRAARRRILRCSDEIRRKERHSEEFFNDVLDDITNYKQYCSEHPEFQNEKAVLAIQLVERTYRKCIDDDDFL